MADHYSKPLVLEVIIGISRAGETGLTSVSVCPGSGALSGHKQGKVEPNDTGKCFNKAN